MRAASRGALMLMLLFVAAMPYAAFALRAMRVSFWRRLFFSLFHAYEIRHHHAA